MWAKKHGTYPHCAASVPRRAHCQVVPAPSPPPPPLLHAGAVPGGLGSRLGGVRVWPDQWQRARGHLQAEQCRGTHGFTRALWEPLPPAPGDCDGYGRMSRASASETRRHMGCLPSLLRRRLRKSLGRGCLKERGPLFSVLHEMHAFYSLSIPSALMFNNGGLLVNNVQAGELGRQSSLPSFETVIVFIHASSRANIVCLTGMLLTT